MSAPLRSMTGFARADGAGYTFRWTWELRSVNGKGLEARFRLPPGFEDLEMQARERVTATLARGNVQVSLTLQRETTASRLKINEDLLAEVLALRQRLTNRIDLAPPSLDGLLAIKGIVEFAEDRIEGEERNEPVNRRHDSSAVYRRRAPHGVYSVQTHVHEPLVWCDKWFGKPFTGTGAGHPDVRIVARHHDSRQARGDLHDGDLVAGIGYDNHGAVVEASTMQEEQGGMRRGDPVAPHCGVGHRHRLPGAQQEIGRAHV